MGIRCKKAHIVFPTWWFEMIWHFETVQSNPRCPGVTLTILVGFQWSTCHRMDPYPCPWAWSAPVESQPPANVSWEPKCRDSAACLTKSGRGHGVISGHFMWTTSDFTPSKWGCQADVRIKIQQAMGGVTCQPCDSTQSIESIHHINLLIQRGQPHATCTHSPVFLIKKTYIYTYICI